MHLFNCWGITFVCKLNLRLSLSTLHSPVYTFSTFLRGTLRKGVDFSLHASHLSCTCRLKPTPRGYLQFLKCSEMSETTFTLQLKDTLFSLSTLTTILITTKQLSTPSTILRGIKLTYTSAMTILNLSANVKEFSFNSSLAVVR